ncbi:Polysaccharide deacetylase family protein OS=Streptomyces tendae OX=1932 GN=GUR47_19275 PE=4 SV=1 [Streptomyces tendae]
MAATRRMASHRMAARAVVAAVCAASLAGCAIDNGTGSGEGTQGPEKEKGKAAPAPKNAVRLIGDGSTAYTGAQPHLPRPERLKPGQKPPQFVVFSWDGAGEDSQKLFSHFREVAKENNATMTYFLSGVYMLPTEKRDLYSPPQHSPGRWTSASTTSRASPTP